MTNGYRRSMRPALLPLLLAAGCAFDTPANVDPDAGPDAAPVDGPAPDAMPCVADTIVCDDATSHYVACDASGVVTLEMQCPLGCSTTSEQCVDVDPSNGLATYLDMAAEGPDVVFTGTSTIDAFTGTVFNAGISIDIPSTVFNGMRIFRLRSLTISGTLTAERDVGPALVFVVDGDVVIDGKLDVSADFYSCGPGGLPGGIDQTVDTCNGGSTNGGTVLAGAGGGGAGSPGGTGGASGAGGSATVGGISVFGDPIEPLVGGCAGGSTIGTDAASGGGAGGGAVQIVSRTRISVLGTGAIDASGGGGGAGGATAAGGGGGAGGAVLLEAPQVVLDGAVIISTKGGSGAAVGVSGANGGLASGATPGGVNATLPDGGAGGIRGVAPGNGQPGTTGTQDGGGGGGSVGHARFNTASGLINPQNGAAIYSQYTTATIGSRLVP